MRTGATTRAHRASSDAGADAGDHGGSAAVLFARSARALQEAARAAGLASPAFRSPPRRPDCNRTIRRLRGGAVVAVRIQGRRPSEIQRDMVEGVLAANGLHGAAAVHLRGRLLGVLGLAADSDVPRAA